MAALAGKQVDNALIEINGEEVPILDGSAEPFVKALETAGTHQQDAHKIYYTIDHNITYVDEEKKVEMVALPYHSFRINTLIDFNSPVLGTQHAALKNINDFNNEIAFFKNSIIADKA
jgi:UDP-3-O-[3-hydroxymyristoyl] N-acetylglucosamine deacetylase/3-hydroxyacyl-[acyl-carrier-protein] dehydratase